VDDGLPGGASAMDRVVAASLLLDAVGFNTDLSSLSGDLTEWSCEGPDGISASKWLRTLVDNLHSADHREAKIKLVSSAIFAQITTTR
jgi:hypothetical protein